MRKTKKRKVVFVFVETIGNLTDELWKHRTAKQERRSVGLLCEKICVQERWNTERNGKIEEHWHAEGEGPQECVLISGC